MSYKKTMQGVKYLVQNELDMACKDNGERFHSAHEAYAVIKEEADELNSEYLILENYLGWLWHEVKEDAPTGKALSEIEDCAIKAACEAIQVAAMARKAIR